MTYDQYDQVTVHYIHAILCATGCPRVKKGGGDGREREQTGRDLSHPTNRCHGIDALSDLGTNHCWYLVHVT